MELDRDPVLRFHRAMAFGVSPLEAAVRPVCSGDEEFLVALSMRVFTRYLDNPVRAIRRMMRSKDCHILVAVNGEQRLGFVVTTISTLGRDFGPLLKPSVSHLDAIAVRPDSRGRGVARRLLAHAEASARSYGAISMSLLTAETNKGAQRLFLGAGYQVLATFDDVYVGSQRALSMFKSL